MVEREERIAPAWGVVATKTPSSYHVRFPVLKRYREMKQETR